MSYSDFQHFYVDPEHVQGNQYFLDGDEYRHAVKVMRKQTGDDISAVDGLGRLYHGTISEILRDRAVVQISRTVKNFGECRIKLVLAPAGLKRGHIDLVIEKGVEIGVAAFQPMITTRTISRPEKKSERWQKKAITAVKQCGRSKCPQIYPPRDFQTVIRDNNCEVALIAHEDVDADESFPLTDAAQALSVLLLIGPEGGFTDKEFEFALEAGVKPVSLGTRRLRAETAALVAATKVLAAAGELGAL